MRTMYRNTYALMVGLVALLAILQWGLWFAPGGWFEVEKLRSIKQEQKQKNEVLAARNKALTANITDLKKGQDAIEESARSDLGMIKPNEHYYQIVGKNKV